MGHKGSWSRVKDRRRYAENHDRIFGNDGRCRNCDRPWTEWQECRNEPCPHRKED